MPINEYQCEECGHKFEELQKLSESPLQECPQCGKSTLRKLLGVPGLIFKGTGWTQKGNE